MGALATGSSATRRALRARLRWLALASLPIWLGAAAAQGESTAQLEADARQGQPGAMVRLAARYDLGEGVATDFARANQLYCEAARRGNAEAQLRLGVIYANGRSVPRDEGIATALFEMAARQGHSHARRLLEYMVTELQRTPSTRLPACMQGQRDPGLRLSRELGSAPKPEK